MFSNSLIPFDTRFGLIGDFDNLIGRFFTSSDNGSEEVRAHWTPRINLSETDKQYEVSVDLPGMQPDALNVELKHGDLWINGERHGVTEEKGKSWHRVERCHGQFRRTVRLGDDVDSACVDAEYKDGVLRITVPKIKAAQTKHIQIKC